MLYRYPSLFVLHVEISFIRRAWAKEFMQQQEERPEQPRQSKQPGKRTRQELPAEAYQLAEHYRLGKPTAAYGNTGLLKHAWAYFLPTAITLAVDGLAIWFTALVGNWLALLILTPLVFVPLLWLAYTLGKRANKEVAAASAYAYFCQLGMIYLERRRTITLRWEEIERSDVQYGWIRHCHVMLGNGEKVILANSVGENLHEQIRRRLLRSRKKRQHPETFRHWDD